MKFFYISTVIALSLVFLASSMLHGEEPPARGPDDVVRIASKDFTESRLLAHIMAELIEERTNLTVDRSKINIGGTKICFDGMIANELDIYPEYTGTGWVVLLNRPEVVTDPLKAYAITAQEFQSKYDITWLAPFGFVNTYCLAMPEELAAKLKIVTIGDLAPYMQTLRFRLSGEFRSRADGWPGLAKRYQLNLANADVNVVQRGSSYLAARENEADVIDGESTDAKLERYNLRVLNDDRQFFPPYDAAPIIRSATLRRYPELRDCLNLLAYRIDGKTMTQLNYQVEAVARGDYQQVARAFLVAEGLIEGDGVPPSEKPRPSTLNLIWNRRVEIAKWTVQHIKLTLIAMALAIGFGVPVGILLTRKEWLAAPVLIAAGVIQTIPSLALLAFMIPIPGLGLGVNSAIAALFLYALLPILRNTYTGIRGVDPELIEAGRGLGLKPWQLLWYVQIPLALKTIMAGIRTATIICIGIATLAAFVGAGGLGEPILTGLQLADRALILSGAIPAALLAIVADVFLGFVERRLVSPGLNSHD